MLEGFTIRNGRAANGASGNPGQSGDDGGGILCMSSPTIRRCIIRDCRAGDGGIGTGGQFGTSGGPGGSGGGVWTNGTPFFANCLIFGNQAGNGGFGTNMTGFPGQGGGAAVMSSFGALGNATFLHCTLAANAAGIGFGPSMGGGLFVEFRFPPGGPAALANSVVWGNQPATSQLGVNLIQATFTDVEGGYAGAGNIDADPEFVNAIGGDFHLGSTSPCLDVADAAAAGLPAIDLDGHPRILDFGPDMGSDEHAPLLPGSNEDFSISSTVNGEGSELQVKSAQGGDLVTTQLVSPLGGFDGALPILVAQAFPTGFGPGPVFGFPEVHVDPQLTILVFDGGNPVFPLPPGGFTLGPGTLPPGLLVGLTLRLQGFALSSSATNGFFAATRADDLVVP